MTTVEAPYVECFFDCSSPWSYLGFHNLRTMMAKFGLPVAWRPIVVGGIFNRVNQQLYALRDSQPPAKHDYFQKDLRDWARRAGLTINFPPACGHPVNAVACMRLCLVAQEAGLLEAFATAAFEALWRDGRDLATEQVLTDLCTSVGLDPEAALPAARSPEIKTRLHANGDELIARGGFGSPTFFVGESNMFFGNDRLVLLEETVAASIRNDSGK